MQYPYIFSPKKFPGFIEQLKKAAIPDKINSGYLKALGYTSSNDLRFISVLKFLNIIDSRNTPIKENYKAIRPGGAESRKIWAKLIKIAYSNLFAVHPNAFKENEQQIKTFFASKIEAGEEVIIKTTKTFFLLCSFADFTEVEPIAEEKEAAMDESEMGKALRRPITINVNIQLEIPVTKDEAVYDKLFSAMAKHILKISE